MHLVWVPRKKYSGQETTEKQNMFTLTEEQKMVRDMAMKFARDHVALKAAELDEKSEFPSQHLAKMAELGLFGYDGKSQLWRQWS